jgi:hypothetical protein
MAVKIKTFDVDPYEAIRAVHNIDYTVPHYSETKEFLDRKARETMNDLRKISNELLTWNGEQDV